MKRDIFEFYLFYLVVVLYSGTEQGSLPSHKAAQLSGQRLNLEKRLQATPEILPHYSFAFSECINIQSVHTLEPFQPAVPILEFTAYMGHPGGSVG